MDTCWGSDPFGEPVCPPSPCTQTPSLCLFVCLTDWMSVCLTDWLADRLTHWLTICLTDCLNACLSFCLTDWLNVCLSVSPGRGERSFPCHRTVHREQKREAGLEKGVYLNSLSPESSLNDYNLFCLSATWEIDLWLLICLCVCVCLCVFVCMCVSLCVCVRACVSLCLCVYVYVSVCLFVCVCLCVWKLIWEESTQGINVWLRRWDVYLSGMLQEFITWTDACMLNGFECACVREWEAAYHVVFCEYIWTP